MTTTVAGETGTRCVLAFVKTTLIGGVVFLAPLLLVVVLFTKATKVLRRLAQPLGAWLPIDRALGIIVADFIVVLVIVVACFGAGLLARFSFANRFIKKAEAGVLWRIPGYGFVKGLTNTLDHSAAGAMRPVLVHFDDCAQLAFEVDRLGRGCSQSLNATAPSSHGP